MDKITKQKLKRTLRKSWIPIFIGISIIMLTMIVLLNISVKEKSVKKEMVASNIYYGCIKTEHEERILIITQANYFIENECLDDGSGEKNKELNSILSKNGFKQYSEAKYSLKEEIDESAIAQILAENDMILDFNNKEYNDFCNR